jgi:hypothetical protein
MNGHDTPQIGLDSPISAMFEAHMPHGNNTRVGLFAFPAESGREKLALIVHGAEAELLMRLILETVEPIFEKAEVA